MAIQVDTPFKAFKISASVNEFRFAALSAANTIAQAGAASAAVVGVTQEARDFASGRTDWVTVKLLHQGGTFKITAGGAISAGADIYVAATGKATATANAGGAVAVALEAASADGDVIEAAWKVPQNGDIETVAYTAIAADGVAGYYDFVTGLSAAPSWYQFQCFNGSTGAPRTLTTLVWTNGTARATVASLATGDKMMLVYRA